MDSFKFLKRVYGVHRDEIIAEACAEVWHKNVNDIEIVETPENQLYEIVGTYEGEPIQEECSLIITKSKIQQNECAASVKK